MNSTNEQLPQFLVIGAGKSGTTSLDQYFSQHPQVFMARKEPCYFSLKNIELINDPNDKEMIHHYPNGVNKFEDYLHLFNNAKEGQIKGEVSPIYLNSDIAPVEIKKTLPNAKLIAILRHPAERLYSRYLHLANEFRAPNIDDLFDLASKWHWRNDLVKEGYYGKNLQRFYDIFEDNQIKVILFEDFRSSPQEVMSSLYSFINVDLNFTPDMTIEYNQSGFVKNRKIDWLLGRKGIINRSLKKVNSKFYAKLKSNATVYKGLLKIRNKNIERPKLSLDLKRKITHEFYIDDIKKLEQLLGRDLTTWYKF